eukprot:COSAG06_NODE_2575_length_6631_cov_469.914574_4_plen_58_part_00
MCTYLAVDIQPLSWGDGATGPPEVPEVPEGSTTFLQLRNAKGAPVRNLGLEPGVDAF